MIRKKPKQERSKSLVDAILEAATRILPAKGFEKSTTNKIAELAGISIGSLYQYFPNKESLVSALLDRHLSKVIQQFEARVDLSDEVSINTLTDLLIRPILEDVVKNQSFRGVLGKQIFRIGGLDLVVKSRKKLIAIVRELLERNSSKLPATLRADQASYVIVSAVAGVMESLIFDPTDAEYQASIIDETIQFVNKYLRTE